MLSAPIFSYTTGRLHWDSNQVELCGRINKRGNGDKWSMGPVDLILGEPGRGVHIEEGRW